MFLADLPHVLLRWWYLVVAGLVCTGALAVAATKVVPPTYRATAEVLILPPSTAVPKGGNPYLALGGLNAIGGVLSTALTDNKTVADLKGSGSSGEYTVGLDQLSPAPMLIVTADEPTEEKALGTVQLVLDRMPAVLKDIQRSAAVPDDSYITTTLITKSDKAEAQHKTQIRAVLVAVAGGLIGTLMVTALVSALFTRTRRRRPRVGGGRPLPASQDVTGASSPPDASADLTGIRSSPGAPTPRRRLRPTYARRPSTSNSGDSSGGGPQQSSPVPYASRSEARREVEDDHQQSEYSTHGG